MRLKFWIGIAVSLGLLVFLFSRIDLAKLWDAMKSVNPYYLAASTAVNLSMFYLRAVRWRYFMAPVKTKVPYPALFSATLVGFMANNVLPARLGEFVRAYVLGRREDVSKSSVFATIVVERLFDGLSVLLLLIIVLALLPPEVASGGTAVTIRRAGMVTLGLYFVIMAFLGYFIYRPHALTSLVRRVFSPFSAGLADKAAYAADSFILGLGVVREARLLFLVVASSVIFWGLTWTPVYLMFKAFGLPYGVYESVFLQVVICFSVALPSTPGYVGTFHAAIVGGLMLLGMGAEAALGFAILSHASSYIPVTLNGLYYLSRENLSFSGMKKLEA